MPIDIEKKLFFIHIPKTGGSSVERALGLHPHQVADAGKSLSGTGKHLQHLTYDQALKLNRVDEINSAIKFCIIRNPIDRFRSEFRWRKKINHPLTRHMSEYQFAKHLEKLFDDGCLHKECHFRFQSDYFYVDGEPSPDIKVFRLEDGMDLVENWVNTTFDTNITISHSNATKKVHEPIEANIKSLVKKVYSLDAEKLGYKI